MDFRPGFVEPRRAEPVAEVGLWEAPIAALAFGAGDVAKGASAADGGAADGMANGFGEGFGFGDSEPETAEALVEIVNGAVVFAGVEEAREDFVSRADIIGDSQEKTVIFLVPRPRHNRRQPPPRRHRLHWSERVVDDEGI